jgi:heme-degrading monooxygenase HmoA
MIGVFVTFRYGENFDEQAVRKIAETARPRFEGMPGLRSKAFTVNSRKREATNFYIWDSEDAAKAFFTDALLERVTSLYGVRADRHAGGERSRMTPPGITVRARDGQRE